MNGNDHVPGRSILSDVCFDANICGTDVYGMVDPEWSTDAGERRDPEESEKDDDSTLFVEDSLNSEEEKEGIEGHS